jgi:hypothetical protein
MAKKTGIKISMIAAIRIIVFLFIGLVLFTGYVSAVDFLTSSPLFAVKDVVIDRSIQFIDLRALKDLKGANIFRVDINRIDRQISQRYPYIDQLRVMRQLPDRILVLARKREPLMQIYSKKKYLILDTQGVALYYIAQPAFLPQVYGIPLERNWPNLGRPFQGPELAKAVEILNAFRQSPYLRKWRIFSVQAGNLSKIDLGVMPDTRRGATAGENMHIMLDQDDTQDKIEWLRMLVSSNKIDLNKVKYIDLRFKEPVIADNDQGSK